MSDDRRNDYNKRQDSVSEDSRNRFARLEQDLEHWKSKCETLRNENFELIQTARDDARNSNAQILAIVTSLNNSISQKDELISELRGSQKAVINVDNRPSAADVAHRANSVIEGLRAELETANHDLIRAKERLGELEGIDQDSDQLQAARLNIEILAQKLKDKDLDIQAWQDKSSLWEQTAQDRMVTLKERDNALKAKDTTIAALTSRNVRNEKNAQQEQKKMEGTVKTLEEAKKQLSENLRKVDELKMALDKLKKSHATLQHAHTDLQKKLDVIENVTGEPLKTSTPRVSRLPPKPRRPEQDSSALQDTAPVGHLSAHNSPTILMSEPSKSVGPQGLRDRPVASQQEQGPPDIGNSNAAKRITDSSLTMQPFDNQNSVPIVPVGEPPNLGLASSGSPKGRTPSLQVNTNLTRPNVNQWNITALPSGIHTARDAQRDFYLCPIKFCGLCFDLKDTEALRSAHMANEHKLGGWFPWDDHILPQAMLSVTADSTNSRFYCQYPNCGVSQSLTDLAELRRHALEHSSTLWIARDINEHGIFHSRIQSHRQGEIPSAVILSPIAAQCIPDTQKPSSEVINHPEISANQDESRVSNLPSMELRKNPGTPAVALIDNDGFKMHRRKTPREKEILAAAWEINQNPDRFERKRIARSMMAEQGSGLDERQIFSWFYHKRKALSAKTDVANGTPANHENEEPIGVRSASQSPSHGSNNAPAGKISNKDLARPGAPQGEDGLERLKDLIYLALQSAKQSSQPINNPVISQLLGVKCISSPNPLTKEERAQIHRLIRESFPHIASWQVQAWEHAIRQFAKQDLQIQPTGEHAQAMQKEPPAGNRLLESIFKEIPSPTTSQLDTIVKKLVDNGMTMSREDVHAWFVAKSAAKSGSSETRSDPLGANDVRDLDNEIPETANRATPADLVTDQNLSGSTPLTNPVSKDLSTLRLTCLDCASEGRSRQMSVPDFFKHYDTEHPRYAKNGNIQCPLCSLYKIRRFTRAGLWDHIRSHPALSSLKGSWTQFKRDHNIENDSANKSNSLVATAEESLVAQKSGQIPGSALSRETNLDEAATAHNGTVLQAEHLQQAPTENSATPKAVQAESSNGVPRPSESEPTIAGEARHVSGGSGETQDNNTPANRQQKPLIKQSNRCTACIETKKYCDGEPVCERCKSHYLGHGLPEKYCIYPFVSKDKNVKKITPADYITLPSSASASQPTLPRPVSVGKFWRPSTEDDFPELPQADILPATNPPKVDSNTILRPARTKRASNFVVDVETSEDDGNMSANDRRRTKRQRSLRPTTPTKSRGSSKTRNAQFWTATPASVAQDSPRQSSFSVHVSNAVGDESSVQKSNANELPRQHGVPNSLAKASSQSKEAAPMEDSAIAEQSLRSEASSPETDIVFRED